MDTIIETPAGNFHAFGIETASSSVEYRNQLKGYSSENRIVSYYAPGIGKIYEEILVYLYNPKTDDFITQLKIVIYLNKTWWDK